MLACRRIVRESRLLVPARRERVGQTNNSPAHSERNKAQSKDLPLAQSNKTLRPMRPLRGKKLLTLAPSQLR